MKLQSKVKSPKLAVNTKEGMVTRQLQAASSHSTPRHLLCFTLRNTESTPAALGPVVREAFKQLDIYGLPSMPRKANAGHRTYQKLAPDIL